MEQDSEHEEDEKKCEEAGTLGVTRSLSPVGRDQQPSEIPKQLVPASFLPSLHFTLLDEDNITDNAIVSEKTPCLSDSAAYERQLFSLSNFCRPHSTGPDHRRHSVHSNYHYQYHRDC